MSTRSHDKTVDTPDNPVYDVLFFFVCKQVFVCFQESFNTTVSSRYSVCRWIFFLLRDHRRTSPFSNLDFGTELLLFPNCFISECSVFFVFFLFCFLMSEIPPHSLSLRLKYQFFTRHTRIFQPCTVLRVHTLEFKYQVHTRHRVAPRLLMKVKSRFNCEIM